MRGSGGLGAVELIRVAMPLVAPFRTSFGTQLERDALLLRVELDGVEGWAECVSDAEPFYSSEYVDGSADVLRRFLVPMLRSAGPRGVSDPAAVGPALAKVKGHRMAKAAL